MVDFETLVYALVAFVVFTLLRDQYYALQAETALVIRGLHCKKCRSELVGEHHHDNKAPDQIENVNNSLYDVREACKQFLALEDHLDNKGKLCKACICKHFLTAEMFLEEAIGLDTHGQHTSLLRGKPDKLRAIAKYFAESSDFHGTAQQIRKLRRELVQCSFKYMEPLAMP